MKKLFFFLFFAIFISCSSNNEEERFYRTYRQILIARAATEDSLKANAEVLKIIQQNGYSEQEFRKAFFELASKEKDFIRVIDSLRNSVKNDYKKIIDSTKSNDKKVEE